MQKNESDDNILVSELQSECLKQSVLSTFSSILNEDLKFLGSAEKQLNNKTEGIIGIISLIGDISWSIMLGLPKNTVITLVPKFTGFDIEYDSEDMGDVVGELANIVAGDLVARLDEIGTNVNMSLPTVARGSDLELLFPDRLPSMRMGFSTKEEKFWIKVAIGRPQNNHRNWIGRE